MRLHLMSSLTHTCRELQRSHLAREEAQFLHTNQTCHDFYFLCLLTYFLPFLLLLCPRARKGTSILDKSLCTLYLKGTDWPGCPVLGIGDATREIKKFTKAPPKNISILHNYCLVGKSNFKHQKSKY